MTIFPELRSNQSLFKVFAESLGLPEKDLTTASASHAVMTTELSTLCKRLCLIGITVYKLGNILVTYR